MRRVFGGCGGSLGIRPEVIAARFSDRVGLYKSRWGTEAFRSQSIVYGHLIPGENVAWIDTLDTIPQKVVATDAHQPHTHSRKVKEDIQKPCKRQKLKKLLAAPQGFEPRYADPESAVLPLNEGAAILLIHSQNRLVY